MKFRRNLKAIVSGYLKALRGVGLFVFLICLAALASIIIVFPLWYGATHARDLYTVFAFAALGVAVIVIIGLRVRKLIQESGPLFKHHLLRAIVKVFFFFLFLGCLYGVLWLFAQRYYFIAVPVLAVYLLLLGYIKYGNTHGNKGAFLPK